jgi:hypothetical protein
MQMLLKLFSIFVKYLFLIKILLIFVLPVLLVSHIDYMHLVLSLHMCHLLRSFTVTYEVLHLFHLSMATTITLLLLTHLPNTLGFTFLNLSQMHLLLSNSFMLLFKINFKYLLKLFSLTGGVNLDLSPHYSTL